MNRLNHTAVAACAALVLTLGSIGAIVTVPSAQAAIPASIHNTEIA